MDANESRARSVNDTKVDLAEGMNALASNGIDLATGCFDLLSGVAKDEKSQLRLVSSEH